MNEVSRPPVRMRSSTNRPISLSANAVTTAARSPKARRRPRATLYSPPPSQARKDRAVRIRPPPGARRRITSPRDTPSKRHSDAGRMLKSAIVILLALVSEAVFAGRRSAAGASAGTGIGRQLLDTGEIAGLDTVARDHPRATDGRDRGDGQVLGQVLGSHPAGGHEPDVAERGCERSDRGSPTGGPGRDLRWGRT